MSHRPTKSPNPPSAPAADADTPPRPDPTPPPPDAGRNPPPPARPSQRPHHSRFRERGEVQMLPRPVSRRLHLPRYVELFDVRFFRLKKQYLVQAALASLVMMILLVLVDSVADAVLAVGLASSAVIVFVHPNSKSAAVRHLLGGHAIGLTVGMAISIILYHADWLGMDYTVNHWIVDLVAGSALGIVILLMSITDTEHPPAAATAVGFAWEGLEPIVIALFLAGIIVLSISKATLRSFLRDLD